jgi:hypothetical protein
LYALAKRAFCQTTQTSLTLVRRTIRPRSDFYKFILIFICLIAFLNSA